MNLLISLYDRTGNWSQPYREAGWEVIQIDIQNGRDVFAFDYRSIDKGAYGKTVVIAAQPCTDYALSGAAHFRAKDSDGRTAVSNRMVDKTREIIHWFQPFAWAVENPASRIHKLNGWLGQRPKFSFHPCDFAGYDPVPDNSRYNKTTWLFGKFNDPVPIRLEPLVKEFPGHINLGGKSLKTKNERSITPLGFAYAFFAANH